MRHMAARQTNEMQVVRKGVWPLTLLQGAASVAGSPPPVLRCHHSYCMEEQQKTEVSSTIRGHLSPCLTNMYMCKRMASQKTNSTPKLNKVFDSHCLIQLSPLLLVTSQWQCISSCSTPRGRRLTPPSRCAGCQSSFEPTQSSNPTGQ